MNCGQLLFVVIDICRSRTAICQTKNVRKKLPIVDFTHFDKLSDQFDESTYRISFTA